MEDNLKGRDVLQLNDVKLFRKLIDVLGSWPHKDMGTKTNLPHYPSIIRHTLLFVISLIEFIAKIVFLKRSVGIESFELLGQAFISLIVGELALIRIILPWQKKYRELFKDFLFEFHLYYDRNKSVFNKKIYNRVYDVSILYMKSILTLGSVGWVIFNLCPIINNYQSGTYNELTNMTGTFDVTLLYAFPVDYRRKFKPYIYVTILNVFLSAVSASIAIIFDIIINVEAIHIWGHLKVLENNLNEFPRPQKQGAFWYSNDELRVVAQLLKENIEHHKQIHRFSSKTSDVFGAMLFVFLVGLQVSGCILLFQLSEMTFAAFMRYGVLTVIMFQELIQYSLIFEVINTMSQSIILAVYDLPWECMDTKNRKTVLFFLQNVQDPISVKVLGVIPVGFNTMISILKASVSYCVMLRTFAYEE